MTRGQVAQLEVESRRTLTTCPLRAWRREAERTARSVFDRSRDPGQASSRSSSSWASWRKRGQRSSGRRRPRCSCRTISTATSTSGGSPRRSPSHEQDVSAPEPSLAAPLADELLVADIAELFGVSEMTVRRWRAGKSNPPIDPEAWIKVNAKDWRYPVSAIDDRALARVPADDPGAALDRIRRKRAVLGFGNRKGQPITVDA